MTGVFGKYSKELEFVMIAGYLCVITTRFVEETEITKIVAEATGADPSHLIGVYSSIRGIRGGSPRSGIGEIRRFVETKFGAQSELDWQNIVAHTICMVAAVSDKFPYHHRKRIGNKLKNAVRSAVAGQAHLPYEGWELRPKFAAIRKRKLAMASVATSVPVSGLPVALPPPVSAPLSAVGSHASPLIEPPPSVEEVIAKRTRYMVKKRDQIEFNRWIPVHLRKVIKLTGFTKTYGYVSRAHAEIETAKLTELTNDILEAASNPTRIGSGELDLLLKKWSEYRCESSPGTRKKSTRLTVEQRLALEAAQSEIVASRLHAHRVEEENKKLKERIEAMSIELKQPLVLTEEVAIPGPTPVAPALLSTLSEVDKLLGGKSFMGLKVIPAGAAAELAQRARVFLNEAVSKVSSAA